MQDSVDLMIRYFDEMKRGQARLAGVSAGFAVQGGVSGLAMTVLTAVVRAASPPTVPQIGRSLGHPRQTIQRHADALAADALIEWIDNPDHKSAKRLVPTEASRKLHEKSDALARSWAADFVVDLGDLATTLETMQRIREKLERDSRGGGAN